MPQRPEDDDAFGDATEVMPASGADTAQDPRANDTDVSTDIGAPPEANCETAPGGQRPIPSEFDQHDAPPSAFADATVSLPTFGRGGGEAPSGGDTGDVGGTTAIW